MYFSGGCYLDSSNGASVSGRALVGRLARRGWPVEVVCGSGRALGAPPDPIPWLGRRGWAVEEQGPRLVADSSGVREDLPAHLRLVVDGVPIAMQRGPDSTGSCDPDRASDELSRLLDHAVAHLRPDVLIGYGSDRFALSAFAMARSRGIATAFALHNFQYTDPSTFADVDAALVPSRFAADYYREAMGLDCIAIPNLVDPSRFVAESRDPKYLVFVNPAAHKGVWAFARIADELGRRRPDIPILVVESGGTEADVASCGLDLRARGNVFFMRHTDDPRSFWRVARVCILPSLWWENQPLVAVEAMANGVPVVGSDRGGIPEVLGDAGIVLPLPGRLTPTTRDLPSTDEVEPWVGAVIRLWDDGAFYAERSRRSRQESGRWSPDVVEPHYLRFFDGLRPRGGTPSPLQPVRIRATLIVPPLGAIAADCERSLVEAEAVGLKVVRQDGTDDLIPALCGAATAAIDDGDDAILIIDPSIVWRVHDARRLLVRPEPVVAAGDPRSGHVARGWPELHPVDSAGLAMLRIRVESLRRVVEGLKLRRCLPLRGPSFWPFFVPIVLQDDATARYLGPGESFCHRLREVGIIPLVDPSILLFNGRDPDGPRDESRVSA